MNSLSPPPYIKDSVSINDNNYDIGGNMIGIDPIITRIPTNTKPYFQNEHLPPDYNNILHDGNIIHQNNNINDNINNTEADIIINGICQNNKSVLDICKNAVYFLNNIVKCLNLIFAFNNIFYILYFKTYYILLSIFITISINQLLRKYNPLSIFLLGIITITDLSIKTILLRYNNIYIYILFSSIILNFYILYICYIWVCHTNKLSPESINDLINGYKP